MSFFKELSQISEGLDLTIRIKGKNGKLTVSVLPDSIDKVQPLITTGTPEMLDEKFFDSIRQPLTDAHQVVVNREEFDKSLKDAKPKAAATDNKKTSKATPKKAAKAKPEKEKKAAPVKADKPKPEPKKEETKQEGPKQLSIV